MQLHIPIPFRYAVGQVAPTADTSQDITSTSAMFEGGVTTAAFRREWVTGDPSDVSLEQCVYFLYAWGGAFNVSTEEIMYHGATSREASSTVLMTVTNVLKTLVKMELNALTSKVHTCVSVLPPSWVSTVKRTAMNALPLHHVRMEETVTTPLETMTACVQTTGWGRTALKMSMSVSIIPARIVEAVKMKLEVITARVWISGQEQTVT